MNTQSNQGIYEIRNLRNGKRYVGSAINVSRRWCEHRYLLAFNSHHSRHLQASWNKYGAEAFTFGLVERVRHRSELVCREQWHLDALRATGWFYNTSPTAGSTLGARHTAETRAKMSAERKGRPRLPCSQETRAKLSAAAKGHQRHLGHKHTAEVRAKLSASHKGHKHTDETRAKIAAALKGREISAETRAKISASHKGHKHTDETRAKMSAAQKGKTRTPLSPE